MEETLSAIHQALQSGDKRQARRLLRPLLEAPTPDLWFLASQTCDTSDQELGCLRQALKLDSKYGPARQRYTELRDIANMQPSHEMPPIESLVADLDQYQPPPAEFAPAVPRVDIYAAKRAREREARRRWNRLGCAGSILLSLSLSYFVLTVTGSPIPAQIRQLVSGAGPAAQAQGTPIFGRPNAIEQTPTPQRSGPVSVTTLPGFVDAINPAAPTHDAADQTYADEAQAAGFEVKPTKSEALQSQVPAGDVLDPGFSHEYTFRVSSGGEFALAVQFFSPTAKRVDANVAILDPDGYNAADQCQRDNIFVDGSGVAFICQVHKSGDWKVQLFGRENESTGVYVVTYQPM